jgi:hypothetical protein
MARLVSPLSNSGSYARLPILRQRETYPETPAGKPGKE